MVVGIFVIFIEAV